MAGIVLAGGKSARMGTDKAMMPWGGSTLLHHVVRTLQSVEPNVVVVADTADKYEIEGVDRVVGDEHPGNGPLGGILTGLNHVENGYHVVLACDMPYVKIEVLRLLLSMANGHQACVPLIGDRLEPLCAVYHRGCRPGFRKVLQMNEDISVHGALGMLNIQTVSEDLLRQFDPELRSFINLNTLEEYGRINPSG
jgi:molybdopterin-guanine dinucleotide biosynthesis protein A